MPRTNVGLRFGVGEDGATKVQQKVKLGSLAKLPSHQKGPPYACPLGLPRHDALHSSGTTLLLKPATSLLALLLKAATRKQASQP